jgi:hypothetical protein
LLLSKPRKISWKVNNNLKNKMLVKGTEKKKKELKTIKKIKQVRVNLINLR